MNLSANDYVAYALAPMDWWWAWHEYEPSTDPCLEKLFGPLSDTGELWEEHLGISVYRRYKAAIKAFLKLGWEADGSWYFAGSPCETGYDEFFIACKQKNNGTTYVLSPWELPWLEPIETIVVSATTGVR